MGCGIEKEGYGQRTTRRKEGRSNVKPQDSGTFSLENRPGQPCRADSVLSDRLCRASMGRLRLSIMHAYGSVRYVIYGRRRRMPQIQTGYRAPRTAERRVPEWVFNRLVILPSMVLALASTQAIFRSVGSNMDSSRRDGWTSNTISTPHSFPLWYGGQRNLEADSRKPVCG